MSYKVWTFIFRCDNIKSYMYILQSDLQVSIFMHGIRMFTCKIFTEVEKNDFKLFKEISRFHACPAHGSVSNARSGSCC